MGLMKIEVTVNEGTVINVKGVHVLPAHTDAPINVDFSTIIDEAGNRISKL